MVSYFSSTQSQSQSISSFEEKNISIKTYVQVVDSYEIQWWFQQSKGFPTPPAREGLEHTSTLRWGVYRRHPPEGEAIPILVQPEEIAVGSPEREEISVTVWGILMGWVV